MQGLIFLHFYFWVLFTYGQVHLEFPHLTFSIGACFVIHINNTKVRNKNDISKFILCFFIRIIKKFYLPLYKQLNIKL